MAKLLWVGGIDGVSMDYEMRCVAWHAKKRLTTFVGANLLQASFSGFSPLAKLPKETGLKPGVAFHQALTN